METNSGTAAPAEGQALAQNQEGQTQTPSTNNNEQAAGAAQGAAQEAMRKFKLKVDGQEVEVDEEELKKGYTHQKAATKRFQEGVKAKKMADDFMKAMKNPDTLVDSLFKLGYEKSQIRKLAESFLAGELEEELLDPKEKELRTYKSELENYKKKEQEAKEAKEKADFEQLKAKYAEDYNKQFIEALKDSGLRQSKALVGEMAKYIARAAKIKYQMTPKEAAQLVKEDEEQRRNIRIGEADAETLIKILGEDGLKKVREYDTSRLKDPNAGLKTPTEQGEISNRSRNQTKRFTPQEWREFNRK